MKYELNAFIKNHLVFSWRFKSINQVCKFLEFCDRDILTVQIYRIGSFRTIDPEQLMKIWNIDRY